ncbi:glycosyltransferase [Bacteroides sp.]|uniref:glycosyltransferase family 2 protein n=1 Tax=Bacteroides sp. TaxID=29523 RepID=UPI00260824AC|nr:glycosyltransferase [Bacteroides sp.]MDD3038755.1 glycosyltransferase [Bacteroides sp.]
MISFIIIGRNEGERLRQCFNSVLDVIKADDITQYNIVYVDSQSTDGSVELAKSYNLIKTILITGECNAAVARNIGAKEAKGDILFFIDGDMEIQPGFLPKILKSEREMIYPFISGIFIDYVYNTKQELLYKNQRIPSQEGGRYEAIVGGLFLIEKAYWIRFNGMDMRQKRSQDYDLGLRMAKSGTLLFRKDQLLAYHHMVSYGMRVDKVSNIKYTALLFRKHWNNKYYIPTFVKQQYTTILLLVSLVAAYFSWWFFCLYNVALAYKIRKQMRVNKIGVFTQLKSLISRDILFYCFLLFFWPNQIVEKYEIR